VTETRNILFVGWTSKQRSRRVGQPTTFQTSWIQDRTAIYCNFSFSL